MRPHTLTTSDDWFIEKRQVDPLSRTPFAVGHNVVVCENQHVLLAEFYSGECPLCSSRSTMPFSRESAVRGRMRSFTGACPKCFLQVSILYRQQGTSATWKGRCPSCARSVSINTRYFTSQERILRLRQTAGRLEKALVWSVVILVVGIVAMSVTGWISHTAAVSHYEDVVAPRTSLLFQDGANLPDLNTGNLNAVNQRIMTISRHVLAPDALAVLVTLANGLTVFGSGIDVLGSGLKPLGGGLVVFGSGFKALGSGMLDRAGFFFDRNRELFGLFGERTVELYDLISTWIGRLKNPLS